MLRVLLGKMLDSHIPDTDPWLVKIANKVYFKNIAVSLFCSVFMVMSPYLQTQLIKNDMTFGISALVVFLMSFLSASFLYTPFITALHKARITRIWKNIRRDVSAMSVCYAGVFTTFFLALQYFSSAFPEANAIYKIVFTVLLFALWQIMLLKTSNIVCNAEAECRLQLRAVLSAKKAMFTEVALFNFGIMVVFLFLVEQYFFQQYGIMSDWSAEQKLLFSQNVPIIVAFFTYPYAVVLSYCCYSEARKRAFNSR